MSHLIHFVYNSAATVEFSDTDLLDLLGSARNKNASLNISGILLYVDGCFFQILEGPDDEVDRIVETIRADTRHSRMTEIIREPIAKRSFQEWTMGFAQVTSTDLSQMEGLNDFFTGNNVLTDLDSGRAKKLLHAFSTGRWRVRLATLKPDSTLTDSSNQRSDLALSRPPFSFAFQPIVDTDDRQVVGYEAQVRGINGEPTEQLLQQLPLNEVGEFDVEARRKAIGIAHRLGLTSCLYLNMVPQAGYDASRNLHSTIETAQRCEIDLSKLILQLKHEAAISDPQTLAKWLLDFRRIGMRICIRDFGSGHAGYALLDRYQPDMVSLASWMLNDIEKNGPRQAIVRGLLQTCNDLGIDVLARGISSMEQYLWLVEEGINLFQGSLFAESGFESLPRPVLPMQEEVLNT